MELNLHNSVKEIEYARLRWDYFDEKGGIEGGRPGDRSATALAGC
jgi:hypothetical protein